MSVVAGPADPGESDGAATSNPGKGHGLSEADGDAVGRLRRFAADHGGGAVAVIENIGRVGARIVAIAPDGTFGDAVVSSVAAAEKVCVRAGFEIKSWDRELTAGLTISREDRERMAGTGR